VAVSTSQGFSFWRLQLASTEDWLQAFVVY